MDPSGNSNGGPSGVGDPSRTTSHTSNNHQLDLSQSLESNSSFDSDIPPSCPEQPESKIKKRRKQSRPSRIPDLNRDSDLNPLNLSKGSSGEGSYFFPQPSFAPLFPNLREIGGSGGSGGSHGSSNSNSKEHGTSIIPPNRIFNPEAYCDLCNKEFCNKYFLKTHKANKHGVYSDTPPTNGSYLPQPTADPDLTRRPLSGNGQGTGRHASGGSHNSGDNDGDDYGEDEGGFSCHFCGSDFPSEVGLRTHLGDKHGLLVPPFLLPFPPSATSPSSLFDLSKNSPSEAFDCSRCSRSFSTLYLLRMHTSYFHPPTPPPSNNNNKEDESIKEECLSPEETGETTSDSDELRRLQSMILDLNPPLGDGTVPAWNLRENTTPALPPGPTSNPTAAACPVCAKEFYSATFLAQHMEQSHAPTAAVVKDEEVPKSGGSDAFLLPTPTSGSTPSGSLKGERRPSPSLSRSYCTICHKELCNKYFMRTHMLKMHGISIESSTGLGGVTCDICNKELCSKYFLKVHKQNTHGILDEGPSPPAPEPLTSNQSTPPPPPPPSDRPTLQQSNSGDPAPLDLHANSEGCPICSKRFRSVKWLKNHLLTDHGQEGRDAWKVTKKSSGLSPKSNKPRSRGSRVRNGTSEDELGSQRMVLDPLSLFFGKMESGDGGGGGRVYRCNFCPFTTTLLVYHYAHERTHTGLGASRIPPEPAPNTFQCPMCFQGVGSLEAFQQHLFSHGLLPPFLPPPSPAHTPAPLGVQMTSPPPSKGSRGVNNNKLRVTERRKRKRLVFRCSACKLSFGERAECLGHVKRDHHSPARRRSGKDQKLFRCRKCSFASPSYAKWRVHFKVHHDRPAKMFEVLGGGSGVVLQRFLLGVGEDEPFVPSLVYLPVRAKVSGSVEVSFSLTPRS